MAVGPLCLRLAIIFFTMNAHLRLTTCEFSKEDVARLAMDLSGSRMGSPEVQMLLSVNEDPTAQKVAQVYEMILVSCKTKRWGRFFMRRVYYPTRNAIAASIMRAAF